MRPHSTSDTTAPPPPPSDSIPLPLPPPGLWWWSWSLHGGIGSSDGFPGSPHSGSCGEGWLPAGRPMLLSGAGMHGTFLEMGGGASPGLVTVLMEGRSASRAGASAGFPLVAGARTASTCCIPRQDVGGSTSSFIQFEFIRCWCCWWHKNLGKGLRSCAAHSHHSCRCPSSLAEVTPK
ncbi:hypothetical protein PLESTB_001820800 [Pleodorina starrii]|uniref:Uncharacterized protein n=1 Tax=Pleodorina starrii TaxID=330485 RepID=A0A9W6C0C9_9CHLO|nr:hypothetical protein PLESTB_001820800 [Pleodorina starrii]